MEIQIVAFIVLILVFSVLYLNLQLKKETTRIEIANKDGTIISIDVEIASNMAKRMRGLMFRKSLGENEGMLFVFDSLSYHRFWMMNTTIPLDAIHIDSNGTVVDIIPMEPCKSLVSCPTYTPKAQAKYVLEVNQGFAERKGIVIGSSSLSIPYKK